MKVGDVYRKHYYGQLITITDIGDRITYQDCWGNKYKRIRRTFERDFTPVDMTLFRQKTIEIKDLEYCDVHSDYGEYGLCFHCPICKNKIIHSEFGTNPDDMQCECREWKVEIKAIGRKKSAG